MKKILCTVVALALMALALPVLAETAQATLIGTWVPYSITMGGVPIQSEPTTMTFNEDGTCVRGDGTAEGSTTQWTLTDEGLTLNGALFTCTLEGDVLTLSQADTQMVMTLVREGVNPADVIAAPTGSTDPADLIGTWSVDMGAALSSVTGGTTEGVDMPDLTYTFTFNEDGTFVMTAFGQTASGTYTAEDGAITVNATEPVVQEPVNFTFAVTEDGILYLSAEGTGSPMPLTRQAAE